MSCTGVLLSVMGSSLVVGCVSGHAALPFVPVFGYARENTEKWRTTSCGHDIPGSNLSILQDTACELFTVT